MSGNDRRIIEDYLPIEAISAAGSSEPRTKGHISTLHLWRARRPLVACRAAIYGALVPVTHFAGADRTATDENGRERAASADFVKTLSKYPGAPAIIAEARRHILEAHADRLTQEDGRKVSVEDIERGRAPRPKVLDMFAGGGAIPLEALRLGCEAHALELNPVAHLIELCTVTYPQQFGPSLADDIETWAKWVLKQTWSEVGDLYARLPVPNPSQVKVSQSSIFGVPVPAQLSHLSVVAYYWTRTIPCPNPSCRGTVPLYRQTWLRRKASGYIALRPRVDREQKRVLFDVIKAATEDALGFDPEEGSSGSATVCPFCQAAVDSKYVRSYGNTFGFGQQLMCVIALNPHGSGKLFLTDIQLAEGENERQQMAEERAAALERELGYSSLDEEIPPTGNAGLATGKSYLYGIRTFRQAFMPRQRYVLLAMARAIRAAHSEMIAAGMPAERAKAVTTYLGLWLSRLTDRFNGLARWHNARETVESLSSMKRIAMTWDFPEVNLFGGASGDALGSLDYITAAVRREASAGLPAQCSRGSATELPYDDQTFDAVVTDPPYYDNESYSELSDVNYVWLRPTLGFLFPEHFAGSLTPKKKEIVAAAYRQGGVRAAKQYYEDGLFQSLQEAHRVLKPSGILVMVYAHKTTAGWATLVEAIRRAGFEVAEAWPLDTETKSRAAHQGDAALASSIFLVARKRAGTATGSYEEQVRPELERIVRERVETLWGLGVAGADLVIAAVGAGLRAFTRFAQVEYANGEEIPAERFLAEVEGVVLETLLERIFGMSRSGVATVDGPTRFYVLWRYTYRSAEIEAGEAIVFTYSLPVELDGPNGLTIGSRALAHKRKKKDAATYYLLDFTERGHNEKLGLPDRSDRPAPIIDVLHKVLWLMENAPRSLPRYLDEVRPDHERLRLVAQALAGAALKGTPQEEAKGQVITTSSEQSALAKLTANWRVLVEQPLAARQTPLFDLVR